MTESKRTKREHDWRNRPRKPAAQVKTAKLGPFRVTPAQLEEIKQRAAEAELTLCDYVIGRAIQ